MNSLFGELAKRGCAHKLFTDVDGQNHRELIAMLSYYLTEPALVMGLLDELHTSRRRRVSGVAPR
jgi:hypothetical protein